MDVREKLVELLNKANSACVGTDCFEGCKFYMENDCLYKLMADHLISNGVTVQEWISVKDERKPNHGDIALCYMTFGEYRLLQWDDRSKLWVGDYMDFGFEDAAYWQMPQPPKGE